MAGKGEDGGFGAKGRRRSATGETEVRRDFTVYNTMYPSSDLILRYNKAFLKAKLHNIDQITNHNNFWS